MSDITRNFLDISALDAASLRGIIEDSAKIKAIREKDGTPQRLKGKILAMIFEKASTRTRVSFDVGMRELGGETIVLQSHDMQLGRGESIADTARVLSRYVDAIMIRTTSHDQILELAQYASVPVINGLTDKSHPCQIMADILTFEEHKGPIRDRVITWSGDGNNVAVSWIEAAARFDFELRLACPPELQPPADVMDWARAQGARVQLMEDPFEAAEGSDCVVADTWVSMGDTDAANRHNQLKPYQVNTALMKAAREDAIFMHCLPAHRGEEVTAKVIDGPQSVVFDEAENRLHAQKGILAWVFGADGTGTGGANA